MKKIFFSSLVFATAIFAQNANSVKTTAVPETKADPAALPVANDSLKTETVAKTDSLKTPAEVSAKDSAKVTQPVEQNVAKADSLQPAEEVKPAIDSVKTAEALQPAKDSVPAAQPETKQDSAQVTVEKAPVTPEKQIVTEAPVEEIIEEEIVYVVPQKKLVERDKYSFDILADFEIQAGKVLWTSEDDENGDNLEEWSGQANLAAVVESDDFIGKIAFEFYPIDIETSKKERDSLELEDYFSLAEAWAWQKTKYFNFKLGRWDNTEKTGDYFGGYIDGYLAGFRSSHDAENQFQFGFTPSELMTLNISFISTGKNLNTGDLRAVFSFQNLPSIERLAVDIGYRSNIFDAVNDSDVDISHNVSLKASLPVVEKFFTLFAEAALLGLDSEEEVTYTDSKGRLRTRTEEGDWYTPITGGFMFETKVIDRIIVEAEYVPDREDSPYKTSGKHVKDVLGAVYLEKALTDRFTLSAGVHSFGSTKDFVINGNLVGRIN